MYPSAGIASPASSLSNLLIGGSILYLFLLIAIPIVGLLIQYLLWKAAVRNGVIEAYKKMGITGGIGGSGFTGYPPAQSYGAPTAPHAEASPYQPYRG